MSPPLALVTGAPGWLGTRLVDTLVNGLPEVSSLKGASKRRVRCLVLHGTDAAPLLELGPDVECVPGDLTRPGELDPFLSAAEGATLFHCAGLVHPKRSTRELFEVNARGTEGLVAAAARAGVTRLIYVSSSAAIGINPSSEDLFDESSPAVPHMGYGRSKRRGEQAVQAANEAFPRGTVIVRPPWFYGPGQPPRQSMFFSMIKHGVAPIVGRGDSLRSMAYIDNVCQALLLSERVEQARGRTYWIADRRAYAMREIVDTVKRVLERDFDEHVAKRQIQIPDVVGEAAAAADRLLQGIGLYSQKLHVLGEMNKTIACTIERAERELGYDPKIALEEGMRRSFDWMRRDEATRIRRSDGSRAIR